tara:strand:+ start:54 stop:446 length:393 start_codon:yes stop_codon:yes gene_type:complete
MRNLQATADKSAIGLSALCALHCLLLPITVVLYPNTTSVLPNDEIVHLSILFVVIPVSLFALFRGSQIHKRPSIFYFGVLGLIVLILALVAGHSIFGEYGEKILTLVGSGVLILAHSRNFKVCRDRGCCH